MKIFRRKREQSNLEWRFELASKLTRGIGRKEFNKLIGAMESMFEARQKLAGVQTDDEKEVAEIASTEHTMDLIKIKRENKK